MSFVPLLIHFFFFFFFSSRRRHTRLQGDWSSDVCSSDLGEALIGHLVIQDAVDPKLGIVLGDADLLGHIERHFLQGMRVGDTVEEGDDQVEAWLERAVEAPEALHHPGAWLRNNAHALDDEGHDHAQNQNPWPVARQRGNYRGNDGQYDRKTKLPYHGGSPHVMRRRASLRRGGFSQP